MIFTFAIFAEFATFLISVSLFIYLFFDKIAQTIC